jgi:NHL repeat/Glycosyl hydrolases family 15
MAINDLYQRSILIILQNQSPSGAYIASPNFPTYAYCWLRDGSFIAHAMDRTGQPGYTDGPAAQAQFRLPQGITVDSKGIIYVADTGNNCIRKITP